MRKNENEVGLKEEQKAADGFREVIFFPIVQIYKSDQDSRQIVYAWQLIGMDHLKIILSSLVSMWASQERVLGWRGYLR